MPDPPVALVSIAWGWPPGLLLLTSVGVIVWLHLRHRPRRVLVVPSLEPWLGLVSREARRRRRVPVGLLLALHLAAALLLSLAGSDPHRHLPAADRPRVILLDTTTSMLARGRWDAALRVVSGLAVGGSASRSLLAVGPRPRALVVRASDAETIVRAAAGVEPAGAGVDWRRAWQMAAAVGGPSAEVHVVTDGSEARPEGVFEPDGWWVVGQSEANVAVVEARARAVGGRTRLYARVVNQGTAAIEVPVRLLVDDSERDRRTVTIGPGALYETVWTLDPGRWAEVRLDARDALSADDWAAVPLSDATPVVQAIGLSTAVGRAVESLEGFAVRPIGAAEIRLDGSADVTIVEGLWPEQLPPGGCVVFDPRGVGRARSGGAAHAVLIDAVSEHSIGAGLDLVGAGVTGVPIEGASDDRPAWAQPLLEADGRVIAYAGTHGGSRVVVFDFDADASDVVQRLAFPVLVARAVAWAARMPRPSVAVAGESLDLGNVPTSVYGPEGSWRLAAGGQLALSTPGRYEIMPGAGRSGAGWLLGVRAGDGGESDLGVDDAGDARTASGAGLGGLLGWARPGTWLALLAIGALGVEAHWRARAVDSTGAGS